MKSIEFLYLSQEDVIQVGLSMSDTISIVEDVLKDHAEKSCENPPSPGSIRFRTRSYMLCRPTFPEKSFGNEMGQRFFSAINAMDYPRSWA